MDIIPTIIVLYLWYTCSGQSHSPIFMVSIFSMELRPCLLSIFFGKYTVCSLSFTLKVTFPLLQSITSPAVLRKGLPRIMVSGPGVCVCKPRYNTIIWRAENRTHLSKQTRPSTERSRKASNVRGIPFRPDDPLRWVLIVRTQV